MLSQSIFPFSRFFFHNLSKVSNKIYFFFTNQETKTPLQTQKTKAKQNDFSTKYNKDITHSFQMKNPYYTKLKNPLFFFSFFLHNGFSFSSQVKIFPFALIFYRLTNLYNFQPKAKETTQRIYQVFFPLFFSSPFFS